MTDCKNNKSLIIFAAIISAVLIAFTAVLPSVADSLKLSNSNNGSEIGVEATKTATWTDDEYTKGQVQITANATGKDETVPNVLFVGTLCGAHDLSVHTIKGALNSITETSNVDYFFFNNAEKDTKSVADFSNTLAKGEKFENKWPSELQTIFNSETWNPDSQKWETTLVTRNHQALKKFLNCIYEQIIVSKKTYDFIVLEYDQTRISDWYRNLVPDNDPSGTVPQGNYSKFSNENEVASLMKTFYDNKQVIWITDSKVVQGEATSLYKPNRNMNVRTYDLQTRIINFNSLKALLAPALFVNTNDTESSTDAELRQIENGLSGEPVDDKYVLGFDRQIGYGNSDMVGQFLKEAIASLYEYQIVIEDKIDMSDNIKITQGSVSFEIWDSENSEWIPVPVTLKPVVNVNYTTGEVSASVANLKGDNKFRLTIQFEDKSATERFIDTSKDGDPNDGPADVSVVPGAGETKVDEPETELPLDWEIPIYYKVEDAYEGKPGIDVDNDEDNITTSAESKPDGSTASETANIKFQYWSTEIDGKETFVSADFKFVPEPDKTTNRYVTRTYIAHYAESPAETKRLTVTKVWSDGDDFHLDDKITIHMFADELELGTFVMDSSIKWSYTTIYEYQIINDATGLPIKYTFKEDPVDGYSTTYVVEEGDPKTSGNTVITNTLIPGPGPQPTPDPTPDPGVVTPDGHSPVKTSDFTDFMALIVVAGVALSFVLIISRVKARKNKERG